MRKLLLITTCAAALSAWTVIGVSQPSFAQQADQQKHEPAGAERPAAKPEMMNNEKRATQEKTEQREKAVEDKTQQREKAVEDKTQQRDKAAEEKTEQRDKAAEQKTEQRDKAVEQKTEQRDKAAQEKTEERDKAKTSEAQERQKEEMRTKESAQQKKDTANPTAAATQNRNEANRGRQLTERQASDLRQRLQREGHVSETNVNFNVSVGVNVPESVNLQVLPADIVTEYPQYSGYDYVMVQDEVVIVNPQSRAVVEVVGGPPTTRAAAVNPCSTTQ